MQALFIERGIIDFLLVTCFLGGGAAYLGVEDEEVEAVEQEVGV